MLFLQAEKKAFRFCCQLPVRIGQEEEKWSGKHRQSPRTTFSTETLQACCLRQRLAGYHKIHHYLDRLNQSIQTGLILQLRGALCTLLGLPPSSFNCLSLYLHLILSKVCNLSVILWLLGDWNEMPSLPACSLCTEAWSQYRVHFKYLCVIPQSF